MHCPKPSPWLIILINTLIVLIGFMLVDFLYYGLISPGPDPYTGDLGNKLIYTAVISIAFAHLYNKSSRIWAPKSGYSFVYRDKFVDEKDYCKASWPKIANGIIFSLLTSVTVIFSISLVGLLLAYVYIFTLHGIRGDIPEVDDGAVLAGKFILSGVLLESKGKTEDDGDA